MAFIEDGAGTGKRAKVNASNKLKTDSTTHSQALDANIDGDAYNINTGIVTLTNATETPLLYLKNGEDKDMVVEAVVIGVFDSSDGDSTANVTATFVRNPTAGTIVSGATAVDINSNRNYGSANTLSNSLAYKGATGNTMTDGDDHILVRITENSRNFISINEILPKGTAIGVKIQPPTSNTSMGVYVAVICYLINGGQ
jgi:hypothetical protein